MKLDLFEIAQIDVHRLIPDIDSNLQEAHYLLLDISTRLGDKDLKDVDIEDCAYIYPRAQKLISHINKLSNRVPRLVTQLNNVRWSLDLEEGDSPPCEC